MSMLFDLMKYINPVFIETGTYFGETVKRALKAGFEKIYSIEINKEFYENLLIKFEKEIKTGRVNLILGDSYECLPELLKNINCKATFWLDAHPMGKAIKAIKAVPLIEELDAIAKHTINTHTILIDDVRLFSNSPRWSDIQFDRIIIKLKNINKDYSISYETGIIKNDVLVAKTFKEKIK